MSEQKKKSKGWPKVGTLRRGTNKETNEKYSYIVLEPNVEIRVDGVVVPLSKGRNVRLEDPRAKVEEMFQKGYMDEATKDKRLATLAENDWLRYELIIPPPRNED